MDKNKGFTLIELSMVLVIIGLVSGVILVGRDLIHTSELRADITMTRDVSLAVNAFRLKYNCVPGDCATASEKLTGAFNGDGNNAIGLLVGAGGNYSMMFPALWSSDGPIESITVYDHLARANMMAMAPFYTGDGAAVVSQALNSLGSVMPTLKSQNRMAGALPGCRFNGVDGTLVGCHYLLMGVNTVNAIGLGTLPASIPIPDAFYFDSKMDDGVALTGNVLSANSSDPIENNPQFILTTEGSHGWCAEYNFASPDKCTLMIGMEF